MDEVSTFRQLANSETLFKDGAKMVAVRVDMKPAEAIL